MNGEQVTGLWDSGAARTGSSVDSREYLISTGAITDADLIHTKARKPLYDAQMNRLKDEGGFPSLLKFGRKTLVEVERLQVIPNLSENFLIGADVISKISEIGYIHKHGAFHHADCKHFGSNSDLTNCCEVSDEPRFGCCFDATNKLIIGPYSKKNFDFVQMIENENCYPWGANVMKDQIDLEKCFINPEEDTVHVCRVSENPIVHKRLVATHSKILDENSITGVKVKTQWRKTAHDDWKDICFCNDKYDKTLNVLKISPHLKKFLKHDSLGKASKCFHVVPLENNTNEKQEIHKGQTIGRLTALTSGKSKKWSEVFGDQKFDTKTEAVFCPLEENHKPPSVEFPSPKDYLGQFGLNLDEREKSLDAVPESDQKFEISFCD